LTSPRVTTGGWISNILFNEDGESTSLTPSSDGRFQSPRASPRPQRIKKQHRSSSGSCGLPSSKEREPGGNNCVSSPRRGSLNAFMSQSEHQQLSRHSDHIIFPGKVILHCRPRSSKLLFSEVSCRASESIGTTSQQRRTKSEGYTRSNRFPVKGVLSSVASTAMVSKSKFPKVSNAPENGNNSSRDKKREGNMRNSETASVASYETMRSCSTRKQIWRTNSEISMASSIDSLGREDISKPKTTRPTRCQDRRKSTGGFDTISGEQSSSTKPKVTMHRQNEGKGSTGHSIPKRPMMTVDSIPIRGEPMQSSCHFHETHYSDINVRAQRRMSTGTSLPCNTTRHVDSQPLARNISNTIGHLHARQNRRMSTGISSKYAPVTTSLKEEISQIVVKPKHPSSSRSVSSVDLWNGSNTTACTASVSSLKSNTDADKSICVLSTASSKNSNRKTDSSHSLQSKRKEEKRNEEQLSSSIDRIDLNSPSRSRRIMSRLNIFKSKRGPSCGDSAGSMQKRRASADGSSSPGQSQEQELCYCPRGPRAARRASTGAVSELYVDKPSHVNLTTTGAVFPREPVQFVSPNPYPSKKSARTGRRLNLGMLRVTSKKA
jgi:hypothetical protein